MEKLFRTLLDNAGGLATDNWDQMKQEMTKGLGSSLNTEFKSSRNMSNQVNSRIDQLTIEFKNMVHQHKKLLWEKSHPL